ncbi:DUF3592 domain-containing protein [Marinobacter adhaerens]|uniref:DUF3592 domain-containing protein n=1 Tax=Marinobacter adhaerens TaxID=1033846 RepID=UPI001E62120F|nr:DUF3592 domain-containing protein [Marinobacter adhaerens]MCD1649301.1 DUF3592 domain-containing protein [Marinobacter adhaerens]
MRRKRTTDWPLLWSAVKNHAGAFFTLLIIGLIFGFVGGGIFFLGFGEAGAMVFGGFFALIGLALFVYAFVSAHSSIGYYYGQSLLRQYGMDVDGVLTRKEADCQLYQVLDNNNRVNGEYYSCNLLVEFDFQFNGRNHNGAFYLNKADLFDKLHEGDRLPLKVLRLDPSVHKVRERRLANMLKGREPEQPSRIPSGAEITQLA